MGTGNLLPQRRTVQVVFSFLALWRFLKAMSLVWMEYLTLICKIKCISLSLSSWWTGRYHTAARTEHEIIFSFRSVCQTPLSTAVSHIGDSEHVICQVFCRLSPSDCSAGNILLRRRTMQIISGAGWSQNSIVRSSESQPATQRGQNPKTIDIHSK